MCCVSKCVTGEGIEQNGAYNKRETRLGKMYCDRSPMTALEDGEQIWKEKFVSWTEPDNNTLKRC